MDIKNLEKYIKLCRKHGVEQLKLGEIELKLTAEAPQSAYKQKKEQTIAVPQVNYSDESDLFWSSGGVPFEQEVDNG